MKRFARLLSFAAGLAALLWAMRDRFISLALPREPQPPAFRHPDDHPNVPHQPHQPSHYPTETAADVPPDDLQMINGIGPVFADKLASLGIDSFAKLARASVSKLAEELNTYESRVADWVEQANQRV